MAFSHPPVILYTVLSAAATCKIFSLHFSAIGANITNWRDILKEVFSNSLIERLIKTAPEDISEDNYEKLLNLIVISKKFKQKARGTSNVAFVVLEWIYALISFIELKNRVSEQKEAVMSAINELKQFEHMSNE